MVPLIPAIWWGLGSLATLIGISAVHEAGKEQGKKEEKEKSQKAKEEGRKEGREEGHARGEEVGYYKGLLEGKEEGRKEGEQFGYYKGKERALRITGSSGIISLIAYVFSKLNEVYHLDEAAITYTIGFWYKLLEVSIWRQVFLQLWYFLLFIAL